LIASPTISSFQICDALRHELSWTHYRTLLRVEDAAARDWYENEAVAQSWSSRALVGRARLAVAVFFILHNASRGVLPDF
jgi:hypothetical protein